MRIWKQKQKKYGIKNADGRKEIKKFRVEVNETETKKKKEKIKEIKSWFFEKISKINKLLTRLTKKERSPTM